MNELPSVAVILAALISGLILGLNLRTNVEYKIDGIRKPFINIFRSGSALSVAINSLLWLLIVSVAMVAAAVFILKSGDVYPLSDIDRYTFVIIWFLSIFCAKYIRYYCWKRKAAKL